MFDYSKILLKISVIIIIVPESELRSYMVRAHAQGMDGGGYQFLFIKTTLVTSEELADLESTALWERGLPDDEGARQGFENLLYVRNVEILKF